MFAAMHDILQPINASNGFLYYAYIIAHIVIVAALFTLAHDLADAYRFARLSANAKAAELLLGTNPESNRSKYTYRAVLVFCFYLAIPFVAANGFYVAYGKNGITLPQVLGAVGIGAVCALMLVFRPVNAITTYVRWLEAELLAQNHQACDLSQSCEIHTRPAIVAPTPAMAQTLRGAAAAMTAAMPAVMHRTI